MLLLLLKDVLKIPKYSYNVGFHIYSLIMLPGLAGGQHRLLFSETHNTQTRTHAHSHTELCWNWHPALKNVVFCLFASRHRSIEYIFWSDNGTAEQWCCQTSLMYVWRWGGLGCFGGFFLSFSQPLFNFL